MPSPCGCAGASRGTNVSNSKRLLELISIALEVMAQRRATAVPRGARSTRPHRPRLRDDEDSAACGASRPLVADGDQEGAALRATSIMLASICAIWGLARR